MKRNIFWCFLALLPLCLLTYILVGTNLDDNFVAFNLQDIRWWAGNWWKALGAQIIIIWLFFLFHALIKKRFVWSIVILIFQVLALPFYWWFNSTHSSKT